MGVSFDQSKQHRRVDDEKPRGSKLKHGKKKGQSMEATWRDSNILWQIVHSCSVLCFLGWVLLENTDKH